MFSETLFSSSLSKKLEKCSRCRFFSDEASSMASKLIDLAGITTFIFDINGVNVSVSFSKQSCSYGRKDKCKD